MRYHGRIGHQRPRPPSHHTHRPAYGPGGPHYEFYRESKINLDKCDDNELDANTLRQDDKQADTLEIKRLARLSPLDYQRERENAAKRLGISRVSALDAIVKKVRTDDGDTKGQGRQISFLEPEPWPHAVAGAELLDGLRAAITRHVIMSKEAADATALWIVHTYLMDVFDTSPKLAVISPEKQCGKTTLLDVLGIVTRHPLSSASVTAAAVFRVIEMARPTLLIDEADTFLKDDKAELRGILNSSHRRFSAFVLRTVGDDHEPRQFSTWAAVAIAMIGRLPATLEDRSIPVALRRRRPDEAIVPFNHAGADDLRRLARMAVRWCGDFAGEIGRAKPVMPDGIHNRQAENWSPLLAIADTAGGEWPERARLAAKALTMVGGGDDQSIRVMLLTDIRNLFDNRQDDKVTTKDLLDGLVAIEERPWPEWRGGKPISPAALAKLLAPFGVVPVNLKVGGEKVLKGYRREHFEDAFTRYLPFPPIAAATPLLRPSNGHNMHVSEPLPGGRGSGCENSEKLNNHRQSSGVAAAKAPWDEIDECEGVEAAHPKAGSVTL